MELETPDPDKSANGLSSAMDDAPWTSFAVAQGEPSSPLLILCDHATNLLPPSYGTLGLPAADLKRHIGYDIGALDVSLQLGRLLHSTVIWSRFSRLLIDPNRDEGDPTLIMQISDGSIIPGNAGITDKEVQKRLALYHQPYHDWVTAELDAMVERGLIPIVVAIHSFTDVWKGVPRRWEAGVLWDADPRLAFPMLRELRERTGFEIGDNEPYSGRLKGNSIYTHGTVRGLPNVLLEIRQDLIREPEGQLVWATLIADCLKAILADPDSAAALSRVEHFRFHDDTASGERHSL